MGSEPTRYCQKLDSSKRGVAVASGVWPSHRVPLALSVLVLLFIGFALRIYRIAYQSVWWDEAYSLYVAQDGVTAMLGLPRGATQIHWDQPPLYYGLLSLWVRLVGSSEFALRSLSLFFGVLVLAAVYRIARTCFDRTTALTAMSIAVLSPTYVVYSQEVRVYALLPLVYLLQLTILHRLVDASGDPPLRLWVALSVVEALSL